MNNSYKIHRIYNDRNDLGIIIEFPDGKSIADVEDVIFLVKENESDMLTNALVSKTYLEGEITLHSPNAVKIKWDLTNYNNLEIGVLYKAALFCKWTGDSDFDEQVERLFDFQCVQNFHNDN